MSTEDNKALVRCFYEEVFNKKNLAAIDEFFAPNHVDHNSCKTWGLLENTVQLYHTQNTN